MAVEALWALLVVAGAAHDGHPHGNSNACSAGASGFAPRRPEKLTPPPRRLPTARLSQIEPLPGGLLQTMLNLAYHGLPEL